MKQGNKLSYVIRNIRIKDVSGHVKHAETSETPTPPLKTHKIRLQHAEIKQ
jgi:hypothetical protein